MPELGWNRTDVFRVAERACSLLDQGCFGEAAVLFGGLRALDPNDTYAANGLAAAYLALGRAMEAMEVLDEILKRHPNDAVALARRCEILLRMGRLDAAEEDLGALRRARVGAPARRLELILNAARRKGRAGKQLPAKPGDN